MKGGRDVFFWFVIAANIIGAVYGFVFYYGERIASTPFPLSVFVPDCPLYVSLFIISALLIRFGGKAKPWLRDLFVFVAAAGLMKYAAWTMFVIPFFGTYFLSPGAMGLYAVLFIAHLLALLEVFAFIGRIDAKAYFIAVALVWLAINDFADYALGTHPTLPGMDTQQFYTLVSFTAFLSVACPVLYYLALKSRFRLFTRMLFDA